MRERIAVMVFMWIGLTLFAATVLMNPMFHMADRSLQIVWIGGYTAGWTLFGYMASATVREAMEDG